MEMKNRKVLQAYVYERQLKMLEWLFFIIALTLAITSKLVWECVETLNNLEKGT